MIKNKFKFEIIIEAESEEKISSRDIEIDFNIENAHSWGYHLNEIVEERNHDEMVE